jgi:hypothetical protein
MRHSRLLLIFWFSSALEAGAQTSQVSSPTWAPIIEPYEHIYPAFQITAEALSPRTHANASQFETIGQNVVEGLIGVRVKLPKRKDSPLVKIKLRISEPELLLGETVISLPSAGTEHRIFPPLSWRLLALKAINSPQRRKLEFSVQFDAAAPQLRTIDATVHGLNDALVYIEGDQPNKSSDDLDFNWIFAAYVDEQSQAVKRLMSAAQKLAIVDRFDGYGAGPDAVYLQAFALWQALQNRGVRYLGTSKNVSAHPKMLSQRVRFPDESWKQRVVNCVDGSVLLAAALIRAGIDPVLVVVPGHMFLGFYLDESKSALGFLDSSLLGQMPMDVDVTEAGENALTELQTQVPAELLPEFAVFSESVALAERQFNAARAKFDQADNHDYQIISIDDARELGVQAIKVSN